MRLPDSETVKQLRSEYPAGTRVRLLGMEDEYAPVIGTLGTVRHVDDCGTIFVRWDNGSGLGVIYGVDSVEKVVK